MKIVCPSCEAAYEVPEVVLTSRRKMRCARCAHDWVPGGVPAAQAAAPPPPPPPEAAAPRVVEAPPPPAEPEPAVAPDHDAAPIQQPAAAGDMVAAAEPDIEPPQDLRQYLVVRPETPMVMLPDDAARPQAMPPIPPKVLVVPPPPQGQPWLAWGGSIALLVILIAAALIFRGPIMKAWPPSTRVYLALGLTQ